MLHFRWCLPHWQQQKLENCKVRNLQTTVVGGWHKGIQLHHYQSTVKIWKIIFCLIQRIIIPKSINVQHSCVSCFRASRGFFQIFLKNWFYLFWKMSDNKRKADDNAGGDAKKPKVVYVFVFLFFFFAAYSSLIPNVNRFALLCWSTVVVKRFDFPFFLVLLLLVLFHFLIILSVWSTSIWSLLWWFYMSFLFFLQTANFLSALLCVCNSGALDGCAVRFVWFRSFFFFILSVAMIWCSGTRRTLMFDQQCTRFALCWNLWTTLWEGKPKWLKNCAQHKKNRIVAAQQCCNGRILIETF